MNPKTKLFSNKQINTRPLKWYRIREITLFAVFIDFRYMIAVFTGIVLILSVLTQCKSGKNNKSIDSIQHIDTTSFITSSGSDSTNKEVKPEKMDTAATVSFLLPSPDEILSKIFGDKISVNLELINSELNAKKY